MSNLGFVAEFLEGFGGVRAHHRQANGFRKQPLRDSSRLFHAVVAPFAISPLIYPD
jgi:hypothetical protein